MKLSNVKDIAILLALAAGVYILWKSREKIQASVDYVSDRIAQGIVKATGPEAVQIAGQIKLPSGLKVSFDIVDMIDSRNLIFEYADTRYKIVRRDPQTNDYVAVNA